MENFLNYQGKKIFYKKIGSGNAVLLVHGFGEAGNIWDHQIETLKNNYQVIIPDLPGTGQSELIDDISLEGMVEVLHDLIHELDIDSITILGHSMGGYITLAFVEKYYNHVHAFGLIHSSSYADNDEKIISRKKGIEHIKKHGAENFLTTTAANLFSTSTKETKPDVIKKYTDSLSQFSADSLIKYYEAMMARKDRTNILSNTHSPVLFIIGEHDQAVPPSDSLEQSHLPQISFIHMMSASGHMSMIEEPIKCNEAIAEFLKTVYVND